MVIQDPSIVTPVGLTVDSNLSGTSQMFLAEQDIPHAAQYSFTQQTIVLHPEPQLDGVKGRQSNIFIVDVETGVYNIIPNEVLYDGICLKYIHRNNKIKERKKSILW